jgi:predicted RNA-binding Zn ribbon-like protein
MVTYPFLAERLGLDFVNTELVSGGERVELLAGFADLLEWCAEAGVISAAQAATLRHRWDGRPEARRAHRRALELRAALRAMAARLAAGRDDVPAASLEAINAALAGADTARRVVRTRDGYAMRTEPVFETPDQLLAPIAESAAALLTAGDRTRVRACQNPGCVLVFYDTTKNRGRRWCSMAACGNRAKVAAHYRRAREGGQGRSSRTS